MAPKLSKVVPTLALAAGAMAQANPNTKPAISPVFDFNGRVETALKSALPVMTNHWVEDWADIHILDWCKEKTKEYGFSPFDVDTWNVHYDDCIEPWIMCRHRSSSVSKQDMINMWGQMPLGMREYIRHIGIWPNVSPGAGAVSFGDNTAYSANSYRLYVMIHETSHSLDSHALLSQAPAPFSTSQMWKDAYNRDSAVTTEYGRTIWPENFAEAGIIGVVDRNVPGGAGAVHPNPAPVQNQYTEYKNRLGDIIVPRSKPTCTQRLTNGNAVLKADSSAKFVAGTEALPDTSIKGLKIIPDGAFQNVTFVYPSAE